ncbi:MAG: hypothetical protein F9K40_04830 [Kofleriaceae bacterium]|nr:MAG: hypothetical protein F9K40_04830 [Kofleriaceae bacterium]
MNLIDAVAMIHTLDQELAICAKRPWTGDAECVTVMLDRSDKVPTATTDAGFEYLLEVHVALEVLEVFGDREPTLDQKLRLIIFYAENDAFPDWVYDD